MTTFLARRLIEPSAHTTLPVLVEVRIGDHLVATDRHLGRLTFAIRSPDAIDPEFVKIFSDHEKCQNRALTLCRVHFFVLQRHASHATPHHLRHKVEVEKITVSDRRMMMAQQREF